MLMAYFREKNTKYSKGNWSKKVCIGLASFLAMTNMVWILISSTGKMREPFFPMLFLRRHTKVHAPAVNRTIDYENVLTIVRGFKTYN